MRGMQVKGGKVRCSKCCKLLIKTRIKVNFEAEEIVITRGQKNWEIRYPILRIINGKGFVIRRVLFLGMKIS